MPEYKPHPKVRCKARKKDGSPCRSFTTHPSGYCSSHRGKVDTFFQTVMLRCKNCPEEMQKMCPYANQAPMGLCWFELYDTSADWETKDNLTKGMNRIMKGEYRLFKRMERLLSLDTELERSKLRDHFMRLGDSIIKQMHVVGRFKGWEEPKLGLEERKDRAKILMKLFSVDEKKQNKKEAIFGIEDEAEEIMDVIKYEEDTKA